MILIMPPKKYGQKQLDDQSEALRYPMADLRCEFHQTLHVSTEALMHTVLEARPQDPQVPHHH